MCRRIIVGGILLAIICIVVAVAIIFLPILAGKPVVDASSNFLDAIKKGDFAAAYNMGNTSFQQQSVSPAGLQSRLAGFVPSTWTLNNFNVQNDQATVSGPITLSTNQQGNVTLTLQNVNGTWKISSINFTPG
jgi:hypothetical protein